MSTVTQRDLTRITYIAKSLSKKCNSLTKEDLINAGVVAFIENEHKFDPSTGKDIWDYMWLVVAGKVKEYINRYDELIYVPETSRRRINYSFDAISSYNQSAKLVDEGTYFSDLEDDLSYSQAIAEFLSLLDSRQKQVITLRYGLNGQSPLSLDAIGDILGISRQRVRQIEAKSLHIMRLHRPLRYVADLIGD